MVVNWRELSLLEGCESVALAELRGVAQALIRTANVWRAGRNPNKELPLSTAIVMGAFSLPDTQETWHLQYSPIREGPPDQSLIESKSLSITVQNKLLVRILELFIELEQTAKTIWDPVSGDLCSSHITEGSFSSTAERTHILRKLTLDLRKLHHRPLHETTRAPEPCRIQVQDRGKGQAI
jgi:hypothetical protein